MTEVHAGATNSAIPGVIGFSHEQIGFRECSNTGAEKSMLAKNS